MDMPDISYIVSAFDRPNTLICCLASLHAQTHKNFQILVTDNSIDEQTQRKHLEICNRFRALHITTHQPGCYHSAEIGAQFADGVYLAFPSDDSFYVPTFGEEMLKAAREQNLDLVYADQLYNGRWEGEPYHVMQVQPRLNAIDKTSFLLKRSKFYGFPHKTDGYCAADGLLIEQLVREGIRHGRAPGILSVHN